MRRLIAVAAVVVASAAAGSAIAAGPVGATTAGPLQYAALGDSYSSAAGVQPVVVGSPPECLRSQLNYAHLIAAKTHADLTDVTCSGADTSNYYTSQYQGVPPQLDAVSSSDQLVTMTIGGNDSSVFVDSIVDCGTAAATTAGMGSPCKDKYGSSFDNTIRQKTYPALVKALKSVRAKAPHARVAIAGYPRILPKSVGCYPRVGVARGDVPYLNDEQATLNDAVERAAKATGAIYVNMSAVSVGHDACEPIGTRWIEPEVGGTNPVIIHPNALGESKYAEQYEKVLHLH